MKRQKLFLNILVLVFCTALFVPITEATETYPSQPIKLIVPFPPGGGTDTAARFLANALNEKYDWQIIVENRPGAGGTVGLGTLARAEPSGYTMAIGQTSNLSINPHLYQKISYNVATDFEPVISLEAQPMVLTANAKHGFDNVSDLIEYAQNNPGKLTIGNAGTGTVGDITGRFFAQEANIDVLHVPYKGAAPAMNDLLGGQIDAFFASTPAAMGQKGSSKMDMLAITTLAPAPQFPDLPLLAATLPGFEAASKSGIIIPAGTPGPVVAKLNQAVNDVLQSEGVIRKLEQAGSIIMGGTPAEFARVITNDSEKWSRIIKTAGIHIE